MSAPKIFFTSDTHFGHANIIRNAKRPFSSVEEMDAVLIERWNKVVGLHDRVYHLGDFTFMAKGEAKASGNPAKYYGDKLNGEIVLVLGNHDHDSLKPAARYMFESIHEKLEIAVGMDIIDFGEGKHIKQHITLCHYAMKVWNKSHHGAWQLYGHSHGSLPDDPNSLSFDVGVDCWDFTPVSIEQIRAKMRTKTWKAIDHHTKEVD